MVQNLNKQNRFRILGLMSGTSLDGLDLCLVDFYLDQHWQFKIQFAETQAYDHEWQEKLRYKDLSQTELRELDSSYGNLLGEMVLQFLNKNKVPVDGVDFIASHGHTWFHQPKIGKGLQIGNGPELWQKTHIPVICDFRKADLALGGQGAPLVPIGDRDLFPEFQACLNLGGFANISFDRSGKRLAYDIAPCNLPINFYARKLGLEFDDGGYIAASHSPSQWLLRNLNDLDFYQISAPKSLGIEWLQAQLLPLCAASNESPETIIATLTEHSAQQIARSLNQNKLKNVLISGGGSYNQCLIDSIQTYSSCDLKIASEPLNSFKEALIFAYLGLLRAREEVNILASVTGAPEDHCSGVLYPPET